MEAAVSYNEWLSQQNDWAKVERSEQQMAIKNLQDQINYLTYKIERLEHERLTAKAV